MSSKNLLILTQKADKTDPVLGFFNSWIKEFSKNVPFVTVICLEEGPHDLPSNAKILSLGKEKGRSKIKYVKNFYKYIWRERKNYDYVFVHMNQEYVLLAGIFWKILGKKVGLWRNHKMGDWMTSLAVALSDVVFCTSPSSYTAKFKKTKIMPTGINTEKFMLQKEPDRIPRSVLSIGRISGTKNVDLLVKALIELEAKGFDFTATIAGEVDEGSEKYYEDLKELARPLESKGKIAFIGPVPNTKTPEAYYSHELYVNMTPSGSLDKTMFSAMFCRDLVLVCNNFMRGILPDEFIFKEGDAGDLSLKIRHILEMPDEEKKKVTDKMKKYVEDEHGLGSTIRQVMENLQKS